MKITYGKGQPWGGSFEIPKEYLHLADVRPTVNISDRINKPYFLRINLDEIHVGVELEKREDMHKAIDACKQAIEEARNEIETQL